jgi:hypothetical protein
MRRSPFPKRTAALAVVLASLGAGCVTIRTAPPRFAGPWPPAESGPRPAITLTVTGLATDEGLARDVGPILGSWGAVTEQAYRESGLFSGVSVRGGRGDIRVDVEVRGDVWQYQALTVFSYLTLLIVPYVVTTDFTVTTRVTTNGGQPLGTVQEHGRSRTWYQLPLFLFAGFFEPQMVTPGIVYDLDRQSIADLHARGVF